MPSPFPGMNPFLEQEDVWQDFHQSLLPHLREKLSEQVRPAYLVKVEAQVYIHEVPAGERRLLGRGDLGLARSTTVEGGAQSSERSAVVQAPAYGRLPLAVDVERHAYLEIRDSRRRELVTVIEVLSPSNKRPGPDREQYLAKRIQILSSNVHLVELDLLRGGPRLPVEDLPPCDYYAMVSRWEDRPRVGLWPIRLRETLPEIPVPLRGADPDAHLDLQSALHKVYDGAGYEDYLYSGSPDPPLKPEDADWAERSLGRGK